MGSQPNAISADLANMVSRLLRLTGVLEGGFRNLRGLYQYCFTRKLETEREFDMGFCLGAIEFFKEKSQLYVGGGVNSFSKVSRRSPSEA